MDRKYEIIDRIIEYGIYAYIFLLFLSKGEGIRNFIVFGNFGLWLLTLKHRKNLYLLKEPIANLTWFFLASFVFSVVFSLDPIHSLKAVKGDPLKLALLFPVIATVLSDESRLKRAAIVTFFTMVFIVSFGYYSYLLSDLIYFKPDTVLVHAYHNRFAGYINTLLPIAFVLYYLTDKKLWKVLLAVTFLLSILALILSTSRGGYLAFLGILLVWIIYISRLKKYNVKKVLAWTLVILIFIGALSYYYFPEVNRRISNLSTELYTANERDELWGAAFYGFLNRPLFGWGYGNDFFFREEPFVNTPYEVPERGEHNLYLTVMFHQGIVGFLPFLLLVITATTTFWRDALRSSGIKSLMLVAITSIFIGNYIIHAQFESMFRMHHIAVILGLGMAARGINENSHN